MNNQTAPIAADLRKARIAKGWSQRVLSAKAAMTQAQISRIESGTVDLRLSTLLELARLLDFEVTLTPRNALTAVQALVREAGVTAELRTVRGATIILNRTVRALQATDGESPAVPRLASLTEEIYRLTRAIRNSGTSAELSAIATNIEAEVKAGSDPSRLDRHLDRLERLSNSLVALEPDTQRPAYSLEDEP